LSGGNRKSSATDGRQSNWRHDQPITFWACTMYTGGENNTVWQGRLPPLSYRRHATHAAGHKFAAGTTRAALMGAHTVQPG